MSSITPDIIEWLIADPEVSSRWRFIASSIGLYTYIPSLEVSRRNRTTDRHRLKELIIIWRSMKPHTYNVHTLLKVLENQGLKSMYEWVKLMTEERIKPDDLESFVLDRLARSRNHSGLSVRSEMIGRSSTPRPHSCYYSLPASPWPSHSPNHSRPLSVISDYQDSNLSTRSSVSPRSLCSTPNKSPTKKQGVFGTLYRPDLIHMSSARPNRHSSYNPPIELSDQDKNKYDTLTTIIESPRTEGVRQSENESSNYQKRESNIVDRGYNNKLLYLQNKKLTDCLEPVIDRGYNNKLLSLQNKKNTNCLEPVINKGYKNKLLSLRNKKQIDCLEPVIETEKYFDNLISMIEESARGLEL